MKLNELRRLAEKVIKEGGAVGHLMHLYDNRDLTFNEIKSILSDAASGKLTKASEKLDGLNLVFSFDVSTGSLKVARAGGDIKRGGMDAASLANKFVGRGNLEEAFDSAFKVLQGAITSLPEKAKLTVFGPNTNRWYSVEIIYTLNPNVINYDSNSVIFHGWPVFKVEDGNVEMSEDDVGGVDILTGYIDKMQKAVDVRGWKIQGPAIVRMKKLSDGSILSTAIAQIDEAVSAAGVKSSATLGDYLRAKMQEDVADLGVAKSVAEMIVSRCLQDEDAPNLVAIKKMSDKSDHEAITTFVKASPGLLKNYIRPIELAINDFAVELLRGLESTLINDTGAEVERLKGEVSSAISSIESSGDEKAMTVLANQMAKLKSIESITSPVEGVVFIWKGNAYKFTGSFAAANQILGLFKYSRK